jgi:hypothetical protein
VFPAKKKMSYQGETSPIGPDIDFDAPHDRDELTGDQPAMPHVD